MQYLNWPKNGRFDRLIKENSEFNQKIQIRNNNGLILLNCGSNNMFLFSFMKNFFQYESFKPTIFIRGIVGNFTKDRIMLGWVIDYIMISGSSG